MLLERWQSLFVLCRKTKTTDNFSTASYRELPADKLDGTADRTYFFTAPYVVNFSNPELCPSINLTNTTEYHFRFELQHFFPNSTAAPTTFSRTVELNIKDPRPWVSNKSPDPVEEHGYAKLGTVAIVVCVIGGVSILCCVGCCVCCFRSNERRRERKLREKEEARKRAVAREGSRAGQQVDVEPGGSALTPAGGTQPASSSAVAVPHRSLPGDGESRPGSAGRDALPGYAMDDLPPKYNTVAHSPRS